MVENTSGELARKQRMILYFPVMSNIFTHRRRGQQGRVGGRRIVLRVAGWWDQALGAGEALEFGTYLGDRAIVRRASVRSVRSGAAHAKSALRPGSVQVVEPCVTVEDHRSDPGENEHADNDEADAVEIVV
jgi:hypothetical protein